MSELFRTVGTVDENDCKTYRSFSFNVPEGLSELQVTFKYEAGGYKPHNLITVAMFDPNGSRGIAHRYSTYQVIRLGDKAATAGFVAGAIPSGEWTIQLNMFWILPAVQGRGWSYSIDIEGHAVTRKIDGELPRLRSTGRWYKGDLHAHTVHSDASWAARELAESARNYGLDFIALTDHNTVTGLAEIQAAVGNDLLLIPGLELTTFNGHANALGINQWMDWRTGHNGRTINDAARDIRAAGGLFIVVHPDAPQDELCTGCRWNYPDFDLGLAHAVQVWGGSRWDHPDERNAGCLQLWTEWLDQGYRLPAVGGTDTHGPDGWGDQSGWTYVWAEERSIGSILAGVQAGRTYISSGPALHIEARDVRGQRAIVGETLSTDQRVTIRAFWSDCPEAELRVIAGGQVRHAQAVNGKGEIEIKAERDDAWYCAQLWDPRTNDLLAVTSAVYVDQL